MKSYLKCLVKILFPVLGVVFLLVQHTALAQDNLEGRSVDQEFVLVEGKARDISPEENTLTVKPRKGKKVKVVLDPSVSFKGASSLQDIEKANRVKVWYIIDGDYKRAFKVEKLPELGC